MARAVLATAASPFAAALAVAAALLPQISEAVVLSRHRAFSSDVDVAPLKLELSNANPDGSVYVLLATRGPCAFRVSIGDVAAKSLAIGTPMVQPDKADAPYEHVTIELDSGSASGIATSFGSVLLTADKRLVLRDPAGAVITETLPLSDAVPGRTAFLSRGGSLVGCGARVDRGAETLSASSCEPSVTNLATYVPYYYSSDGYAAFGVTDEIEFDREDGGPTGIEPRGILLANYSSTLGDDGHHYVEWKHPSSFDLYLMPAPTLDEGTKSYYALTGAARVLPRYAFGFIASRWGWKDKENIEEVLYKFRSEHFPLDAIITDFEFFTTVNDYDFGADGVATYRDFGYNNVTLPTPKEQFSKYLNDAHIHMGGIRKPRLGGTDLIALARAKGWLMNVSKYQNRYIDFRTPEVRAWYAAENAHYLDDGLSFWWNDEGEADYFTYYWWNIAQKTMLADKDPSRRFFSLNRAFSPGLARLGAAVWTGDLAHTWSHLAQQPGMVLNWGLAGAPYVACDIGGFGFNPRTESSDLLVRWYQVGAFMPIMRVHSAWWMSPHFPFAERWGDAASQAMRQALELRYRLLPYHYSLAHAMYKEGKLWMRPLLMDFPGDAEVRNMTREWLDGTHLLVAPVLDESSMKAVYLPQGLWYRWNTSETLNGPQHLSGHAALEEVPIYARAGAVLPLAPVVQHTGELPGGPIEVQVYAGADGAFDLVEDDGNSTAYESGATRVTSFAWDDAAKVLSWTSTGGAATHTFELLHVTLHRSQGTLRSNVVPLMTAGSITMEHR